MTIRLVKARRERPPFEHLLWHLAKDGKTAEARVRVFPHGRELTVTVSDTRFWSKLFRQDEDSRELGAMATGCRQHFESHGWRLVVDDAPSSTQ